MSARCCQVPLCVSFLCAVSQSVRLCYELWTTAITAFTNNCNQRWNCSRSQVRSRGNAILLNSARVAPQWRGTSITRSTAVIMTLVIISQSINSLSYRADWTAAGANYSQHNNKSTKICHVSCKYCCNTTTTTKSSPSTSHGGAWGGEEI
jgi:hypothetical protein